MFNIGAILDFKRKTHYHTDKHTNMTSAWKFLHLLEGIWYRRTTKWRRDKTPDSPYMESRIWIFQPVVNEFSVVILRPAKHIDTVIKDSKPSRRFKWQFIRWTILSKHTPSTWFAMINFDILCQVRMLFLMSFIKAPLWGSIVQSPELSMNRLGTARERKKFWNFRPSFIVNNVKPNKFCNL